MTLTLAKELCGFDLLPNREVLTCSATGLSIELKQAHTSPPKCQLGNLKAGGRLGSRGGHLVFGTIVS